MWKDPLNLDIPESLPEISCKSVSSKAKSQAKMDFSKIYLYRVRMIWGANLTLINVVKLKFKQKEVLFTKVDWFQDKR